MNPVPAAHMKPEYPALDAFATHSRWPLKLSVALISIGALFLCFELSSWRIAGSWSTLFLSFGLVSAGGLGVCYFTWRETTPGIRHNGIMFGSSTARGLAGWAAAMFLTAFYVVLYLSDREEWYLTWIKSAWLSGWIDLVSPLSMALRKTPADKWFLYGLFYTLAVLIMGVRMLMKYRHNRYHLIRTCSVIFFQLGFAFLIPDLLVRLQQPEFYFTYFWPLKADALFPSTIDGLLAHPGGLGTFMVFWGACATFVATPVLTYFYGKRWYCSWVCGCGGLAETLGDPYRQLSDKSETSWKIERWLIHSVLVLIVVTTALLWINHLRQGEILGRTAEGFRLYYGLLIGAVFSGVIGVGFYPLMGGRVWCRFGCPMAAILGLLQRVWSRFRITTNGDQCMSCGNCSTYCEMGIDVRAYAQRGENIVRSSCVGCGVCAAVCPRGVLKLENGDSAAGRFEGSADPWKALIGSLKRRDSF